MFTFKILPRCGNLIQSFARNRLKVRPIPLAVNASQFSTTNRLKEKIFADTENRYAFEILANGRQYQVQLEPEIVPADLDLDEALASIDNVAISTDKVFENFKFIAMYCKNANLNISDDRFDKFVDLFTDAVYKFSDNQLLEALRYLQTIPQTSSINTKNFLELWKALDTVCVSRIDDWDVDQLLMFCDCWYALNLARVSEFVWNSLRKLGRKIKKLSPNQLVHVMFFCNLVRKPLVEMYELEMNFKNVVDEMSLKQIGVMSMGFFKTQTPLRDPVLIEKIYKRLMAELETVEDITLVNILKVLRYSSRLQQSDLLKELLDKLCTQIDRFSLLSCLHIALMGCDIQHCHDQSIQLIVERFNRDIDNARLKDMERICHVISLYDFKTESGVERELCQKILSTLKSKVQEIIRYPRCLPNCLHYLSLCGLHDAELISTCLDQRFIKHTYKKNMTLGREIFCLDGFAKINLKGTYDGHELTERQRRTMGKLLTRYIPQRNQIYKMHVTDRIMLEIKETAESLYRHCAFKHVLPHFERPDIVVCYDKTTKKFIPLGKECPEDYIGAILTRDVMFSPQVNLENIVTVALITAGWNNLVREKNTPTGLLKLKLQQLELLGHKGIVIPWYEWRDLESTTDRHNYLRRKLASVF